MHGNIIVCYFLSIASSNVCAVFVTSMCSALRVIYNLFSVKIKLVVLLELLPTVTPSVGVTRECMHELVNLYFIILSFPPGYIDLRIINLECWKK